ncbi:MAG TPA: hypothetical protein VFG53_10370 [Anaeromyxobacter sp.]|nr:hypothetical protein [Anaeromyxobacter sp.]
MGRRAAQHHGIRGSAALATGPLSPSAVGAELLEPGEMRRIPFAGELLGAARVRSGFVAVPLDAFDDAAPGLSPEVQAAYLHLLRLSFGEGRNFCRIGKRQLRERLRTSERRLLRLLDRLVERGLARPLHRDNRGTLWRVYLPGEASGAPVGDAVLLGRAAGTAPPPPARPPGPPQKPGPVAIGPLARSLAEARGELLPEGLERAEREIAELLAEGQSTRRIAAGIEALRRLKPPAEETAP